MSRRRAPERATSRNDRPIAFDVKPSEGLAVRAFHPDGFRWFKKLDSTTDEAAVREMFAAWLATATEPEIERFVAAMAAYRQALIDEGVDDPLVLRGDDAADRNSWRKTLKLAETAAAAAEGRARSAAGGRNGGGKKLRQQGEVTKTKALQLARDYQVKVSPEEPTCWDVAVNICHDVDRSPDHVHKVLRRLEKQSKISFPEESFDMKGVRAKAPGRE